MKQRLFLVISLLMLITAPPVAMAASNPPLPASDAPRPPIWTTWGADHYALADDGPALWIGATGGVVRWEKQSRTYRRYTAVDGLPHTKVLAIAVDRAGNRWFGGAGGLSRLDANEQWTHFTTANSGLYANLVDAIAVTADGALYISHGLPAGSISRRQADGSWRWFPNRESAIQADYAAIHQTRNQTPLWTVAGAEIWSGFALFDGVQWHSRIPPSDVNQPTAMVADSANHLWVVAGGIYEWDGAAWLAHPFPLFFSGRITALAVDAQDTIWVGWHDRPGPYANEQPAISQVAGGVSYHFDTAGSVAALVVTAEGVWGVGPGWLALPDGTAFIFNDIPHFSTLPDAVLDTTGKLWFYSGAYNPYSVGVVQTLADQGTAALADDQWQLQPVATPPTFGSCKIVTAFERVANGNVWAAGYCQWRIPDLHHLARYHGQTYITYDLGNIIFGKVVHDIFAQDEQHFWFAYTDYDNSYIPTNGVLSLDDGGTPTNTSDDRWQSYPITTTGKQPVVAVDAGGRLWYGDTSGLYRHTGTAWVAVNQENPVCDLAPAADGTLYVQLAFFLSTSCGPASDSLFVVRPDGKIDWAAGSTFLIAQQEPERVRSVTRRNSLWSVAADGAIWYIYADTGKELQRRDAAGLQTYPLPMPAKAVQRLAVDAHHHVWLVADNQIWRMSPPVDFGLTVEPTTWLVASGRTSTGQVVVQGQGGYRGAVTLAALKLPAGMALHIEPNPVAVNQSARLSVTVTPDTPLGIQPVIIQGSDQMITHTFTLTVTVAETLYDFYHPLIRK